MVAIVSEKSKENVIKAFLNNGAKAAYENQFNNPYMKNVIIMAGGASSRMKRSLSQSQLSEDEKNLAVKGTRV